MKLAITGGGGFLGYHLCNRLAGDFKEIRVLDIASIVPQEYPACAKYLQIDVRDPNALQHAFRDVDLVVHAAAALPLWHPKDIVDTNLHGTENVLAAAQRQQVQRVVHISTTAVYGIPKKHPIEEQDPLQGVGPYGESKVAAERICQKFREKGMVVPIIRPKSFIGTGRMGVFQILYDWVEDGKRIPLIGHGNNRYQLLEVEDLVEAIRLLLFSPQPEINDTFNVGAARFGTVREDVHALCQYAGTGAHVMPTPAWAIKPALALFEKTGLSPLYRWIYETADRDSFVSSEKFQRLLGWESRYSNAEALIRSYSWYLEHKGEIPGVGVTHRTPWKQGILALFKKML